MGNAAKHRGVRGNLKTRTALITGASAGIGRGIARVLSRDGYRLCVVARRYQLLKALNEELIKGGGAEVLVVTEDLLAPDAADRIATQARQHLGHIDVLVNNAGGSRPFDLDTSEDEWTEAMTLNFTRPRQLAHAVLPGMIERKHGRIVNITGKSEPEGINGAFCAKAALHSWAKGLSREVGKFGITVNCVAPGRIMSEQIERNYAPAFREEQSRTEIPMGAYGQPEDIAHLVKYLASPEAAYVTGTVIPVDGGLRRYQF